MVKDPSIQFLVSSHTPKNYKYYIQIIHDSDLIELEKSGYDMTLLDTIQQPDLIKKAIESEYKYYERTVVGRAKVPTIMDHGVLLNKTMATKTDKKLFQVGLSFFEFKEVQYVSVKLCYEKFNIYEIFILT